VPGNTTSWSGNSGSKRAMSLLSRDRVCERCPDVKLPSRVCSRTYSIFLTAALSTAAWGEPVKVPFTCTPPDLIAAGLTCSDDDPCPVYLELSSVSTQGKILSLAGNLHGRAVTLYSLLLSSDDNGVTWKEPTARIPTAALEQVELLDAKHGWAAGETQVPLARDPFFLITSDGGASWRLKPVAEEETAGSVQRFWFDSADHGELIVDAGKTYVLYESQTGGDDWNTVSKTKQAPRLRRAPGGEADYRIGTDSRNHTFIVERHDGAKWSQIASFIVQVASCGSPPPEPSPPPEHPPEPAPGEK
jgi:hypothetical protein